MSIFTFISILIIILSMILIIILLDLLSAICIGFRNTITCRIFVQKRYKYKDAQEACVELPRTRYDADSYCISHRKQLKEFPTITFSQFQDFYYLNPDSWTLLDYSVYKNHSKDLTFTFKYKEWKKYNKWHQQIKKDEEKQRDIIKARKVSEWQDKTTVKILEAIQKDIDKIRAESSKNFNEAAKLIKGVNL